MTTRWFQYFILCLTVFLFAGVSFAKESTIAWGKLPADVSRVMQRSNACNELTLNAAFGNMVGPKMSVWTKTKKQLQCAQILGDIKKLRKRYGEPSVQAALDWAEKSIHPNQ